MTKAMTVRLSEEEEKMLQELANKINWSGVKSKAIRFAVVFTRQCLEQLSNIKSLDHYNAIDKMNVKFKTDVGTYQYR